MRDTTPWDTNLAGTWFQKGFKYFRDKWFWDMNLAVHDFENCSKFFVILHDLSLLTINSIIYSLPFPNFQHRPPPHTLSAKEALMIRYKINKLMILKSNKSHTSGLDAPFDKCKIYLSNRLINASKSKQSLRAVQWNLSCIVCKCALIMMINGHLSAF